MQTRRTLMRAMACAAVLGTACSAEALAAWPGVNGRVSLTQRAEPPVTTTPNRDIFAYAHQALEAPVTRLRLTRSTNNEEQSSWSADGTKIAYKRIDEVWVVDATDPALTPRQITNIDGRIVNNTQPAWSPDGEDIVFRTNRTHPNPEMNVADIWTVNVADGEKSAEPLLVRPGDERYPTYSPDGTQLLFRGDDDGADVSGDEDIFVQDLETKVVRRVTEGGGTDTAPAWSPDGSKIAFYSNRDGDMEIWVVNADGTDLWQLTFNEVHDEGPAWSPDGRFIAFTRAPTNAPNDNGDIWVMNADGSDQRPYAPPTPILEESPDWQPLPIAGGDPAEPWVACGDLSFAPGGIASVVVRTDKCEHAVDVAERWQQMTETPDAPPEDLKGYVCTAEHHTFDQVLVQCVHDGGRKAAAFVYREA
jgi:Tol biopolymer transport system component